MEGPQNRDRDTLGEVYRFRCKGCFNVNAEGWCEACNSWDMTALTPNLVRCQECWTLNEVGSECWCRDVATAEQINNATMTYECGNCGQASEEMYCPTCVSKVTTKCPVSLVNRCNRCFTVTSLTDECPKCKSKVLLPIGADPEDPLLWATQFNRYDHKGPKRSLDVSSVNDKPGAVVILN